MTACATRISPVTIHLSVGRAVRLSQTGNQLCFQFPAIRNARYVLAYADPRLADQAMSTSEWPWPDSVQVEVADRTAQVTPSSHPPGASSRTAPPAAGLRPGLDLAAPFAVPSTCSLPTAIGSPYCRATPWTVGETFTLRPNDGVRPPQPATVLRVSGRLVVAVIAADAAKITATGLARLDTALAFLQHRTLPFLGRVYAVPYPVTSQESGQLLLMLEANTTFNFTSAYDVAPDRGRYAFVSLHLAPGTAWSEPVQNANSLIEIMSHELTHTFQFLWKYRHGGWTSSVATKWSMEGSAAYVQATMTREYVGVGFETNFKFPQSDPDNPIWNLSNLSFPVKNLPAGYADAASFLRDLVQRATDQGMAMDQASGQVLVGALEGWYGVNEDGNKQGVGLTARMQAILGSGWNPRDALLTWTMSQTADEVTTATQYQNKTISLGGNVYGNTIIPHGTIAAGSGASLAVLRGPGTTGTVVLDDNGVGGTFSVGGTIFTPSATPMNQLEWLLLRIN